MRTTPTTISVGDGEGERGIDPRRAVCQDHEPAKRDRSRTDRIARDVIERRFDVEIAARATDEGEPEPDVGNEAHPGDASHQAALRRLRCAEAAHRFDRDDEYDPSNKPPLASAASTSRRAYPKLRRCVAGRRA